jgi:hypothetical protein
MLSWDECIKKGIVRKTSPNKGRIKTLIKLADSRIAVISKVEIYEENASVIFTNYYDALREICEALAISKGYKIYSHEAITLFLREILKETAIAMQYDRFRQLRNSIHYYGLLLSSAETKQAVKVIKELISKLKLKYLKEFN